MGWRCFFMALPRPKSVRDAGWPWARRPARRRAAGHHARQNRPAALDVRCPTPLDRGRSASTSIDQIAIADRARTTAVGVLSGARATVNFNANPSHADKMTAGRSGSAAPVRGFQMQSWEVATYGASICRLFITSQCQVPGADRPYT